MRGWIGTIIKTILFFLLLTLFYFLVFIFPKYIEKRELRIAKTSLSKSLEILSENTTLKNQYSSLKTLSASFADEKKMILEKWEANIGELKKERKAYKRGVLAFLCSRKTKIILSESEVEDKNLIKSFSEMYPKDSKLIEDLKKIDSVLGDVYAYDPGVDFGGMDFTDDGDREKAVERSRNAVMGLKKVKENLSSIENLSGTKEFGKDLEGVILDFESLTEFLSKSDAVGSEKELNKIVSEFEVLRKSAFDIEKKLI